MRPPTRIRDDQASPLARDLLDAARPVRAMTAAERAASAARLAQIGAAPAAGATALWIKGLFGATVIGVAVSIAALSTARPPAPRPAPSVAATAAVTATKRMPPAPLPPTREEPHAIAITRTRPHADARPRVRAAVATAAPAPVPTPAVPASPSRVALVEPVDALAHARGDGASTPWMGGGHSGQGDVGENSLAAESRLLVEANQTRAHDPRAAVPLLLEHRRRFPTGRLSAERDVQLFHALDAMGDRAGARAEGERFLQMHPRHPSAGAIRRRLEAR